MSDVSNFLDSVAGTSRYRTGLDNSIAPSSVAPIVGLNNYSQSSPQVAQAQTSSPYSGVSGSAPASSNSLFSSPALDSSSGGGHYQYDANTGVASPTGGNAGLGTGISALGLFGNLTHNPQLSQIAGLAGAVNGAENGNYTGVGSTLGRLAGVPYGGLLGAALGSYLSPADNTQRFLANAGVSMIPGVGQLYGLANMFTGGGLSNSLFGKDSSLGPTGQFTPATNGLIANLGNPNASQTYGTGSNAVHVTSGSGPSVNQSLSQQDRQSISDANGGGGGV